MSNKDRLAAALAVVAAAGVIAPSAQAAWPGLDGRIVTAQESPPDVPGDVDDHEIVAWSQDGVPTQLTRTRTTDTQPSVSPDGLTVAFRSDRLGSRHEQVYAVGIDGTGVRRVSRDAGSTVFSSQPGWSPGGTRIVFRSNRDTPSVRIGDVYSMALQGADVRRRVDSPATDERYPTLSPDGTRLLFTSDRGGTFGIYVANADGSDPRLLFDGPLQDSAPAWSPDGTQIAFETFSVANVDGDVYVMDADPDTADAPRPLVLDPAHDEGPAWSPDGGSVAFTSTRDGDSDTWVARADGSAPAVLTQNDIYEESPDWQAIPAPDVVDGAHTACGPAFGGAGSPVGVVARRVACDQALDVAARFAADGGADEKVRGFTCSPEAEPHSFDQGVVRCAHGGERTAMAFVGRHDEEEVR